MSIEQQRGLPSRRTFMVTAATATAALSAHAQAVEPLRIGLVGTGSRGCDLLSKLLTIDDIHVAAICDDYPPHLVNGQSIAGANPKAYDRFDSMLEDTALDAVIIATPLHTHYAMSVAAIERGLPVFCEKTMCHTIDEAKRLAALVTERNAIFQVGLQRRGNAIYDQAIAMIHTGMLGTVTTIKCQWHRNDNWRKKVPVDTGHPDFNALERKLNWRLYWASSQGLMGELGSHQLDVVNRALGVPPSRVIAMGGVDYWRDGREVYDNVFCTYEYNAPNAGEGKPQTVHVAFSSIQTNAHEGMSELIMGTKGTLLLSQKLGLFYSEVVPAALAVDGLSGATLAVPNSPWAHRGKPMEITSAADDTRAELLSFVQAVRASNRKTICDVRVGLENTATIIIANEAIRSGSVVTFPNDCRADAHA